jgi:hypothetical protein
MATYEKIKKGQFATIQTDHNKPTEKCVSWKSTWFVCGKQGISPRTVYFTRKGKKKKS